MRSKSNQSEPTLEIDGRFYPLSTLPKEITDLLSLFTRWEDEKKNAIFEVQKLDAALKSLSTEISSRIAIHDATSANS